MTFTARESSRTQGRPIWLYYFRYGVPDDAFYAWTNAEKSVTRFGVEYLPITIGHGRVKASGNLDKATLGISMAENSPLWDRFNPRPPSNVVNLWIRQTHLNEAQAPVHWMGRVLSAGINANNEVNFSCEPISTSMKRAMVTRHFQIGCDYLLYDPSTCKANKAAATIERAVVSASGGYVELSPTWETGPDVKQRYVGGYLQYTRDDGIIETRSIIAITGTGLNTVMVSVGVGEDIDPGETVKLIRGCDHTLDGGCTQHDNVQNHGGFPWIPADNPFGVKNIYV